jgi:hypothetical protein
MTSVGHAASARSLEAEADGCRPTAHCLALSPVSVGFERRHDCPAADRHPVASDGLSTVLALEVSLSGRSAKDLRGDSPPDPMSLANRLWGAPRIHGELLKLGIEVAQSTVAKYMARGGRGRSQTWKTFLHNHSAGIGAMDFLIVPTVGFRLLFVLVILRHERRRLISLSVISHPTAEWIARQITNAFPWEEAPDYIIRDRDGCYGQAVTKRLYGHTRSPDLPDIALAERACGTADRLDPAGMPRSYRGLRRGSSAASSCGLRRLLQRMPNTPVPGQRFARPSADPAARPARCSADPRWTSSSILPDVVLGRDKVARQVSPERGPQDGSPSPAAAAAGWQR